jgi:1-acyl-sn-glycerol-3-phosphate acyltransferase
MITCIVRFLFEAILRGFSPSLGVLHAHKFAASVNPILGIEARTLGTIADKTALIVANHRSYIDATVLLEKVTASFLAKAEVASWPVLGLGTKLGGTLFVKRENRASRKQARKDIADRLGRGISVVVFPEGTTHQGPEILPFKKGVFFIAAKGGIPVVPAAITYEEPADAWVGEESFIDHFLRVFARKKIRVQVRFGPVLSESNPEILQGEAWDWINRGCLEEHR